MGTMTEKVEIFLCNCPDSITIDSVEDTWTEDGFYCVKDDISIYKFTLPKISFVREFLYGKV